MGMDNEEILVELLCDVLGDYGLHYPNKGQISFNCPVCDDERDKHNLEVNYHTNVYKCWSCGDSENTHGPLGKIFDLYGNKKQKKVFNLLKPETVQVKEVKKTKLTLPKSYTQFKDSNSRYPVMKQAKNYLTSRGVTDEMIEKYQIGFCDNGEHSGRIIIPSYNKNGVLNYYISRSWDPKSRYKYKNPKTPKDEIIFWENRIDWDKDIYLVEGVFDGLFIENSIPMLGKHMSDLLYETIYNKSNGYIIIALDADAWENSLNLYHHLNGGRLFNKIKMIKLTDDKDIADLRGDIQDYYYKVRD